MDKSDVWFCICIFIGTVAFQVGKVVEFIKWLHGYSAEIDYQIGSQMRELREEREK